MRRAAAVHSMLAGSVASERPVERRRNGGEWARPWNFELWLCKEQYTAEGQVAMPAMKRRACMS